MKRNFYSLIIIIALILGANGLSAQNRGYVAHNGYDIGLGFGASYQKSDMRNFSGGAGTFFVGHSLYAKPGAFFGMDWRLRFLGGRNMAFDDRMNSDSTYSNVQYTHFNYDLEFELYLNRLRENTGIIIAGFGGGGVTHNKTAFDLSDNGVAYDFSTINAAGDDSRITIYEDLTELSDKQFETGGINHACFSPTLGFYLGYQFTPHFSMGIEHKMNYFIYEYNTGSGADIDGRNVPGSRIDRNNYTALSLRWDIGGGNSNNNVPCQKPVVNFSVVPSSTGYYTHQLNGTVYNVDNSSNITITVDGQPDYNFNYIPGASNISSNYNLAPGSHIIKVTASTRCGSDTQTVQVIVEEPCVPPAVRLTIYEPVVDGDSYRIEGQILNIASAEQINVEVDGMNFRNFTFDPRSGKFVSIHDLYRGSHYIVINARNECGQDSESFQVTVGSPCDAPIVSLSVAPNNYNGNTHQLKGTVANVENASDIVVTVDGVRNDNFRFVAASNEITAMYKFNAGTHTISVSATTECGQDTQTVQVTVGTPCKAPTVDLTVSETTYNGNTHELKATVTGVDDAAGITVMVDGKSDTDFRYVASNGQLSSMYNLAGGTHVISVTAKNSCGQDAQSVKISVATPCVSPEITVNVNESSSSSFTHQLSGTIKNINNADQITVTVDGIADKNFRFVPSSGQITSSYKFNPGNHNIVITAKNECGQDSQTIQVVVAEPCDPPVIKLTVTPSNNASYTHILAGRITNVSNTFGVTVTVDGEIDRTFRFNPADGQLSANYKFGPGSHTIVIIAKNDCGEASRTETVEIAAPCNLPVVTFQITEIDNRQFSHQMTGSVTNVNNKSDIIVTVDGVADNSFQFDPSTMVLSGKFKLLAGKHTITVKAKNSCGEDTESIVVTVAAPCDPPVINFKMSEITHQQFAHEMTGTITNVKNKSDITVTVDGVADNSFQFVPSTMVLSGKFKLSAGKHTIVVTAKNECGSDTETVTVTVAAPCDLPVINFKMSEITHQQFTHEMTGTITNVKNKSDITVTVDGVVDNSFQFVPSTMVLSGKFKLSSGKHTIVVTAKNECGSDTETVTVNVAAPCDPPVINFKMSEITHQQFTHEMTGTITNVKNKSDITVTVDGVVDNSFQFVPSTMVLSGKFKLSAGKHTIVVTAKNECGSDTETVTVTVAAPCNPPVINFKMSEITHQQFTHEMTGTITNVKNKSDITVTVDGVADNSFQFVPSTMVLSGKFKLSAGKHTIVVTAKNECGSDTETVTVNVAAPCDPPVINFKMSEITHQQFTHEMTGTITNVKNKSDITVTVDGVADNSFQFVPSTMVLSGKFKLSAGKHTIVVTAKNECGSDTETVTVTVAAPCDLPVI
ncbi:MAG: hypothetical protein PHE56_08000, partial [Bacteroidales bacterium]|nr:hypothetical protein [Bacteroidales bacterium]